MADENVTETEYERLSKELDVFYQRQKPYLAKFEGRKNVLRDRGLLSDRSVQDHVVIEMLIDAFNRIHELEALTAVLRSEE